LRIKKRGKVRTDKNHARRQIDGATFNFKSAPVQYVCSRFGSTSLACSIQGYHLTLHSARWRKQQLKTTRSTKKVNPESWLLGNPGFLAGSSKPTFADRDHNCQKIEMVRREEYVDSCCSSGSRRQFYYLTRRCRPR
jgi:hypothetical protein